MRSSGLVCCPLPLPGNFSLFKVRAFLLRLVLDAGKLQNDLQSDPVAWFSFPAFPVKAGLKLLPLGEFQTEVF